MFPGSSAFAEDDEEEIVKDDVWGAINKDAL